MRARSDAGAHPRLVAAAPRGRGPRVDSHRDRRGDLLAPAARRRVPRHHAHPGAGQHRRAVSRAARDRAPDQHPGRSQRRRAPGARRGALGLQVRLLAGDRDVRGGDRCLSRATDAQRTPPGRGAAARGRSSDPRTRRDRPRRGLPLPAHGRRLARRAEDDARVDRAASDDGGPGRRRGQHLGRRRAPVPRAGRPHRAPALRALAR